MKVLLSHLGQSLVHFPAKIALPNLIILHEKFRDGGGIFDHVLFSDFVSLPLVVLPLSIVPWLQGEFGHWLFGRWLDKTWGKGHMEGAV